MQPDVGINLRVNSFDYATTCETCKSSRAVKQRNKKKKKESKILVLYGCNKACLRHVVVFILNIDESKEGTRYIIGIDVIDRFYNYMKRFSLVYPLVKLMRWWLCAIVRTSGYLRVTVVRKNSSILVVNERFDIDDTLLFTFNKYTLYRDDKHSTSGTEQPIPPPTSRSSTMACIVIATYI